jgi:hypothetical protein
VQTVEGGNALSDLNKQLVLKVEGMEVDSEKLKEVLERRTLYEVNPPVMCPPSMNPHSEKRIRTLNIGLSMLTSPQRAA